MEKVKEIKIKLYEEQKMISVESEAFPADMCEIVGVLTYEIYKACIAKGVTSEKTADLLHHLVDIACQRAKEDMGKQAES